MSTRAFRPKLEVADIFRRHGERPGALPSATHVNLARRRVMTAIGIYRTDALGCHVERCQDCESTASSPITVAATGDALNARGRSCSSLAISEGS